MSSARKDARWQLAYEICQDALEMSFYSMNPSDQIALLNAADDILQIPYFSHRIQLLADRWNDAP